MATPITCAGSTPLAASASGTARLSTSTQSPGCCSAQDGGSPSSITPCAYSWTAEPTSSPSTTRTTTALPDSVPKSTPTTWASGSPPRHRRHVSAHTNPVSNLATAHLTRARGGNIALSPPCDEPSGRDHTQAPPGHVGRRPAGRGVAPDRVARHQRQRPRARGDARAGRDRHAPARLPAELRGPRARHRPLEDARRGELRHDALRPRVDAVRDRARRSRRGVLHHDRQPRGAGPPVRAGRDRPPARAGRGRDPGDRAAGGRGARAHAGAGRRAARRGRGRPAGRRARRLRGPVRGREARHRAPAGARPPHRLAHRRPGRLARGAGARGRLARRAGRPRGRRSRRRSSATGAPARATTTPSAWPPTPP